LGVDEGADAALLLRFGDGVQGERGLAGGFRPVDFHHPAARQAANAERDIEPERAGGNGLDVHRLVVLAEAHHRALAELALDLAQRGGQGLRFIHGRSFDDTQCWLTHRSRSLWPRFRCGATPNHHRPWAPPESTEASTVHDLFLVRNMFFLRQPRAPLTNCYEADTRAPVS